MVTKQGKAECEKYKKLGGGMDFGFKRIRPVCAVMTIPNTVLLISSQETPVETEQIPFDPSEITEEAL